MLLFALAGMALVTPQITRATADTSAGPRCVVLLHGLARTETSFALMEAALESAGFKVVRPGYPSTEAPVAELVERTLPDAMAACGPVAKVDFVTHSMGGILLRGVLGRRPDLAGQVRTAITLGSPHRGTAAARGIPLLPEVQALKRRSGFLVGISLAGALGGDKPTHTM